MDTITINDVRVTVASKLMDNTRNNSPIRYDRDLAAAKDADGQFMFFSIGSDNHLYLHARDSGSRTGWQRQNLSGELGANVETLQIATAQGTDGQPMLAAAFRDPARPGETLLYHTRNFAPDAAGRWVSRGSIHGADIIQIATGAGKTGAVQIVVATQQGPHAACYLVEPSPGASAQPLQLVPLPINGSLLNIAIGHLTNLERLERVDAALYTLVRVGDRTRLIITSLPDVNFYNHLVDLDVNPTAFDLVRDSAGDSQLLVADTRLFHLNRPLQLSKDPQQISAGKVRAGTRDFDYVAKQVVAARSAEGRLETWVLTEDGDLHVLREERPGQWGQSLRIWRNIGQLTAWRDQRSGAVDIFVIDFDNQLRHLSCDPGTTRWQELPIAFEQLGPPIRYKSYVTMVTLTSRDGTPLTNKDVDIQASERALLAINGHSYFVDVNEDSAAVTTDALGRITITHATDRLAAPIIRLSAPFLSQSLDINPAAHILARIGALTVDDLKQAKKQTAPGTYAPVFANVGEARLVSAQQALGKLSQALNTLPFGSAASGGAATLGDRASAGSVVLVERGSALSNRLNISALPATYSLRLGTSGASITLSETTLGANPFDAIAAAFGDLWQQVERTAHNVISIAVEKVEEELRIVLSDLEGAWTAIVSTAEQVWDVMQLVFAKIGAFFGDVANWLGFLFDWPDILRTRDAIVTGVNQSLDTIADQIRGSKESIGTSYDQLKAFLRQLRPIQGENGTTPVSGSGSKVASVLNDVIGENSPLNIIQDPAGSLGLDKILDALIGDKLDDVFKLPEFSNTIAESARQFVTTSFTDQIDNVEASFNRISADIQLAMQEQRLTPNDVIALLATDVLDGILAALHDFLFGVIDLIADLVVALKQAVNTEIELPLITELYEQGAGGPMSLVNALSLAAAIPATEIYKAAKGRAPYSTSDRLPSTISSTVTLGANPAALTLGDDSENQVSEDPGLLIWTYVSGVVNIIMSYASSTLDSIEQIASKGGKNEFKFAKHFSVAKLAMKILAVATSWPPPLKASASYRQQETFVFFALVLSCFLDTIAVVLQVKEIWEPEACDILKSVGDIMAQLAALGFGIWQFAARASEGLNTSYDKLDAGMLLPQYFCSCLGSSFTSAAVFAKDQRVKIALVATGLIGSYAGTSLNLARLGISIRHDEGHRNF